MSPKLTETESLLQQAFEITMEYYSRRDQHSVFPDITPNELRKAFGARTPMPQQGTDAETVISGLAKAAQRGIVAQTGPRYFGFVIGGSLPVTTAADWLTSAWDQNSGLYATSPAASVVEEVAASWLLELLGLPSTASVGFVTGCGMANFTGLAAARHKVLHEAGWEVELDGLNGAPPINVIVGDEVHVTVLTALRMLGLGTRGVKRVPADGQGRMIASDLRKVLNTCSGPTIVCAQAGNVNTGSFDPLVEITAAAKERRAWVHVDGAFGLWAAVSGELKHLVAGAGTADSWATDAHKWLNVPYDSGLVMCAHPEAHRSAMTVTAAYLVQSDKERDPFEWTPEFSRRGRGFTIYAALKYLGREGVREMIERCCARARQMAELLRRHPDIEILNDVVLNQVLVRFRKSDDFTRQVISRVQQDGTCWLGGTTWKDLAAMRVSVSNWSTTEKDIELSAAAILKAVGD
ncbi:MAG TPA: aminotransferase class V-fold PLP-dependent enzyme [Candidatus Limnocylindrales bacterium]|nr:aminotransferase class V-fold PLP-dependent enzyme [Candidatus Limnocylindrales bacterium]